jgi:integrase
VARLFLMTWVPGRRRWTKKYNGKMYAISPQALGVEPTKEASYQAANAWWLKKQAELDLSAPPDPKLHLDPSSEAIKLILDRTPLSDLRQMVAQGCAAAQLLETLEAASVHGAPASDMTSPSIRPMPCPEVAVASLERGESIPNECIDSVLKGGFAGQFEAEDRQEELKRIERCVRPTKPQIDPDRTIGGQVKAWVKLHEAAHAAGNLSAGRYDAYKRNIKVFEEWIGSESEITVITAFKLEEFYSHLCIKIGQKGYAPSYARSILGATKQFIKRLAELGLIPLPGNIASRKFRFDDGPKEIETFTVEEVRKLLAGCDGYSERTKLFLLLMLNCGMYQNDIAELKQGEVGWQSGTVKRPRSKTPKGPVVTYKLWPETMELLRKFRSDDTELVLTTERGRPLVFYGVFEGKLERYDTIQSAYSRLTERVEIDKPLKVLRKTSSSALEEHATYGRYAQYFLAQSPGTVAERHYIKPSEKQFFAALDWLRKKLLGPGG